MLMASGYADARSPPLRLAEATTTVAIEKAHAVILGLRWTTSRRLGRQRRHGRRRTDSRSAAGRPILAWAPGEDGPNSEKDNPRPRPWLAGEPSHPADLAPGVVSAPRNSWPS